MQGGAQRRAGPRLWVVLGSLQEEIMSQLRPERGSSVRRVKVLERCSEQGETESAHVHSEARR